MREAGRKEGIYSVGLSLCLGGSVSSCASLEVGKRKELKTKHKNAKTSASIGASGLLLLR